VAELVKEITTAPNPSDYNFFCSFLPNLGIENASVRKAFVPKGMI
jgi:hypothetical protein